VKRDFSAAGRGASSSSAAAAGAAAAEEEEEAAAVAGAAKEISGMLRRDCEVRRGGVSEGGKGGGRSRRIDMRHFVGNFDVLPLS